MFPDISAFCVPVFWNIPNNYIMAYTVRITLRYVIIVKLFGKRKKFKNNFFLSENTTYGHSYAQSPNVGKKKKKAEEYGYKYAP